MKPLWVKLLCCTLLALCASEPAAAAWNNVFQVTFFRRRQSQTTVNYYSAPVVAQSSPVVAVGPADACNSCPQPCPQTQCQTSYVQRCYYQPVTTYQTQTYYQPVTTYRTSYYYEPVTCYRYTCSYDPCTCSYRQVAVPSTSYRLRSRCCPVKSWVQRCCSVPVTSYRRCCYWQPQTTCCTTSVGAAVVSPPVVQQPVQQPVQQALPPAQPPSVTESRQPPIQPAPQDNQRYYGPPEGSQQKQSSERDLRQPPLGDSNSSPRRPPEVKLDRIVSNSRTWVRGQVVENGAKSRGNASLLFVNLDRRHGRKVISADADGRFDVSLASGRWEVYLRQSNGREEYHSRIDVADANMPFITLVSRRQ